MKLRAGSYVRSLAFFRSPLEMQLMHYDADRYSSLEEASSHEDGVVGLAFQYDLAEDDNPSHDFVNWEAHKLKKAGSVAVLHLSQELTVANLIGEADKRAYFSYHGSLTRLPCSNTVTWLVFTSRIDISSRQVRINILLRHALRN